MKNITQILIIEDNQIFSQALTNSLEKHYYVCNAATCLEAMAIIKSNPFLKAIILGVYEPVSKGIEAIKIISELYQGARVFVLANVNSYELAKECLDCNVCCYLEKPFNLAKLKEKIDKITENISHEFLKTLWKDEFESKLSSLSGHIKAVIHYIEKNRHRDFNRNELASSINLNPNYLSRLFNKECGMPLKEYINMLRIFKCKKKLANQPGIKIKDIAGLIGMQDASYFCRFFKKHTNLTPLQFKNAALSRILYKKSL